MRYWTAFSTIVIKEVLRFSRIWVQTVLPPAITTALYFVIFGTLIGSQLGEMDGLRYVDFIVPGLILMAVISNSYANVVSSFYQAKFQRNVEELLIAPIPPWVVLWGYVTGGVARGVMVGLLVTLVSMIFSDFRVHSIGITLAVFVLTSVLFSLAGFINAVFANSFDDIAIIPTFVLTPLTYLGGVFYSIRMLPEFWQQVSLANPVLYMINAFRYGLLGVSDILVGVAVHIILGFIAVLFFVALYLLKKGVGIKS
ncbi:ABC transporter permease [endosymbiont of unidentified scaly snail isolate Monju]|uniref:ABC transporter permease n=1 Tax=endosymbiont of unidentified scaly snail isolate Monju TaxID=1248727 RepID=UPI00038929BD|nr:ABC transporter permease [endosymbiont of unidentified scaly snail isolate Monju]BAN69615.1 antibiotic ABC transporter permease [endosymbiont of unidentified scaly snail isolate Monju]